MTGIHCLSWTLNSWTSVGSSLSFLVFFSSCYGVIFDPENVLPFLRGTVSAGNQQTIADRWASVVWWSSIQELVQQEQRNRWRMELYRLAFGRGDGVCSRARTSVNQQSAETTKKKRGSDVRILNVQRVVTASEYKTTVLIIKVAFSGTVSTA